MRKTKAVSDRYFEEAKNGSINYLVFEEDPPSVGEDLLFEEVTYEEGITTYTGRRMTVAVNKIDKIDGTESYLIYYDIKPDSQEYKKICIC